MSCEIVTTQAITICAQAFYVHRFYRLTEGIWKEVAVLIAGEYSFVERVVGLVANIILGTAVSTVFNYCIRCCIGPRSLQRSVISTLWCVLDKTSY